MPKKQKAPNRNKDKGLHERVLVLLTAEQLGWIQRHRDQTSIPVGAIIRRALEQYRASIERKATKAQPKHDNVLQPDEPGL